MGGVIVPRSTLHDYKYQAKFPGTKNTVAARLLGIHHMMLLHDLAHEWDLTVVANTWGWQGPNQLGKEVAAIEALMGFKLVYRLTIPERDNPKTRFTESGLYMLHYITKHLVHYDKLMEHLRQLSPTSTLGDIGPKRIVLKQLKEAMNGK